MTNTADGTSHVTPGHQHRKSPTWMRAVLLAAGLYNLVWGAVVIVAPLASLKWSGFTLPTPYPEHWQCIGMIVGVYGIGYAIAAFDPVRHWPIVLVGLLGKIFGPIGMIMAWIKGTLPLSTFPTILTNDLIWWIPFGLILWHVWKIESGSASARVATAS